MCTGLCCLVVIQARQTLNEIRGALIGVNQRQQWVIDVMTSVARLEQALDGRGRAVTVQVQASLNPGAAQPGAGTGLSQSRPQPTGPYGGPYRAGQPPARK